MPLGKVGKGVGVFCVSRSRWERYPPVLRTNFADTSCSIHILVNMKEWISALMESLKEAPLLVGNLPSAPALDRSLLGEARSDYALSFNQKLGHLYEDALEHLLDQSDALSLVSSNLQVVNYEGRTLGEMDFLLRNKSAGSDYHLELAVKFYLVHRGSEGWSYPGPDARDNWQRKLARMQTHQLRLSDDPDAKRLLATRFGITQVVVRQLIYGRLFVQMGEDDYPLPEGMSADGLRGRWLYRAEWSRWMASATELRVIPKPLWPVDLTSELVQTLPVTEAAELLKLSSERCTMFVADDSLGPIFLVPDSWPNGD